MTGSSIAISMGGMFLVDLPGALPSMEWGARRTYDRLGVGISQLYAAMLQVWISQEGRG